MRRHEFLRTGFPLGKWLEEVHAKRLGPRPGIARMAHYVRNQPCGACGLWMRAKVHRR